MPIFSVEQIQQILTDGQFERLIGSVEDEHLECKICPHQVDRNDSEKMELAKDVSALANSDGGVILLGVDARERPENFGDTIISIREFTKDLVDIGKFFKIIGDWVFPPITRLQIKWHPRADDQTRGIVAITVPAEACQNRPYVVTKAVNDDGKVSGNLIGYFERVRDGVPRTKAEELRNLLKDGLRFSEIDARLKGIEHAVRKLDEPPAIVPLPIGISERTIYERIGTAQKEVKLDAAPCLYLVAFPPVISDFPTLFESRSSPLTQLLEKPPIFRQSGFNLASYRTSEIVRGEVRRVVSGERLLEAWKDGVLIFAAPGDGSFLCWGTQSTLETGLAINDLALAESTYLFADLALKAFQYSAPPPERLKVWLGLSRMTRNQIPSRLGPYRQDQGFPLLSPKNAPDERVTVSSVVELASASAGIIAYKLVAQMYNWFGFNEDQIPYTKRDGQTPEIDPTQLH